VAVGVEVALGVGVTVGEGVPVGVGLGGGPPCAQYLPPVLEAFKLLPTDPPQTIISAPVHTAVCECLAAGALLLLVAVQLSASELYFPPVSKSSKPVVPPQTIISLSVHTAK
jgi:hypothetical protein